MEFFFTKKIWDNFYTKNYRKFVENFLLKGILSKFLYKKKIHFYKKKLFLQKENLSKIYCNK